ncbi:hypothetical protein H4Q26_010096 [Puccinia striiformis f. sp. tritici PST-130]|nr:hypothetical protein H4Q26_010096 [Puccinia striiformis f. sp. tritici PST-130]
MAGLPYTLDDIKQLVLESHMKDLHVLLHQVGSFQSKDGDRVLNWIASQLQDFIFKTVEFLYKYDMIPMSMIISTVLDFIMKNYQDYDVMEFNKRGSPTKEAFDLRYASLDLIEELVRIDKYLHGFYHYQYNDNGEDDLILTLNGKTTSEIASQVGLIDSYIQITYKKHKNLIERLWETNPIFMVMISLSKFTIDFGVLRIQLNAWNMD